MVNTEAPWPETELREVHVARPCWRCLLDQAGVLAESRVTTEGLRRAGDRHDSMLTLQSPRWPEETERVREGRPSEWEAVVWEGAGG